MAYDLKVRAENTFAGQDNLTMKDIEPLVGIKISSDDRDEIKRRLTTGPTGQDFENTAAAKFLKELIDDFGRRYTLYDQVPVMREKAFQLLKEGIQSAKTPLTDRQKKELALQIFNNLQTEPITSEPGALLTPTEKSEELGQSLDKAVAENRVFQKRQVKVKSPYKEYPDAFLENGIWKVIRDGKKYRIED